MPASTLCTTDTPVVDTDELLLDVLADIPAAPHVNASGKLTPWR